MSGTKKSEHLVESPVGSAMDQLCASIGQCDMSELPGPQPGSGQPALWPSKQMELIAQAGVYRWFVPQSAGGLEWDSADVVEGYIRLSSSCLTSAFVLTQQVAALKRICASPNAELRDRLMPGLLSGEETATVGISHLTTSRQHTQPALRAVELAADSATNSSSGFQVDGFSPWVTGGCAATYLLMGAQLDDGRQILFVTPSQAEGISIEPGFKLVGLTESQTGAVKCHSVVVPPENIVAGPCNNVLASLTSNSTGGFQTSSLAIGLSRSAIEFLGDQSRKRPDLSVTFESLEQQYGEIETQLKSLAAGIEVCTSAELRTRANSLVLRATQSALVAAKGSGYVEGHPVGRWCREALFFLVWSCPQAVLDANLCELVGIEI